MATLYIHIPFCRQICSYCDFYRIGAVDNVFHIPPILCQEMEQRSNYLVDRDITSIYFGGGTPSLLHPAQIEMIIDKARELFNCSGVDEITIEANPDDITEEYVSQLVETSVNRVSLGVQSFDDDALRLMNRRHDGRQAERAVALLRGAGIRNISVDIIFGIDGYGGRALDDTLRRAIALDVEHISAYHLTIEPNTRLGLLARRGEYTPVGEDLSEAEFAAVHKAFTDAGYEHYEVSNFAKRGYRAKHNSAYWRGVEYLGLGPGAHSFSGDNRRWCISTVKEYLAGIFRYDEEVLHASEHLNEYVMTSLRTAEGINLDHIADCYGEAHSERIRRAAAVWLDSGILVLEKAYLRIPPEHFLLSDAVIEALFV